ncbi:hypothetical protein GCM10025868_12000 [Angustibacter aerolatus]|uniref:Uncharacterized protein n=1 Tax=Angustibacter aerolatus TaxID=1162965 RepID=A0ABQ6JCQ1_9ACTN|nr:hypothetical protein GCM10025868_12000 [Angustibacter aerolatus]
MVWLKSTFEPAGTVTFSTFATQVPPLGSVTYRRCRTPPVSAADRLKTSSTPAAQRWRLGFRSAYRFATPASTTYIACTR